MTIYRTKRVDWLVLTMILLIAAFLRLGEADIVEFFHDDGMLATLAQEIVTGEQWHWTGIISSTGIPNSPMSVYVLLPAFVVSLHPIIAILGIMVWNVLGVALLWKIAYRYFGRWAAFFAGMTYAVSPWAILYSRKLWAQEYHTPFILLAVLLGLYGFLETPEKPISKNHLTWHEWAQIFCLPIFLIGMQIHFAAWALFPLYGVLLWLGRKRLSWRALVLSSILSLLIVLPFGIGITQTLQADPTRISDAAARSDIQTGLAFSAESLQVVFFLSTGYGMETWVAPAQAKDLLAQVPVSPVWLLLLLCLFVGMVATWQKYKNGITLFLLMWAFLPPLALVLNWTPVYPHYFIACIPMYALLIGIGGQTIMNWIHQNTAQKYRFAYVVMVVFGVIWLTQAVWWRGALGYLAKNHIEYPGFTTPLRYLNPIYDALKNEHDVIVVSDGMAWNLNHESVVWATLLRGDVACVRTLKGDGYAVLPQNNFAVLVAPNAPENAINNFYHNENFIAFSERPGGKEYRLYRWQTAPTFSETLTPIDLVLFDNGVRLTGYHLQADKITLAWQLPDGKRGENYQYSVQLFDKNETRLAQQDSVFWQGEHWCAGDTLFTWAALTVPEDAALLQVGMYQLRDEQYINADVLDIAGNPVGQFVRIPIATDEK
jgi:4-amino-4-deoxy-L-arabinose transferase-like glycosyltransferase